MQSLVKFSRVLPYVFPEVFPVEKKAGAAAELAADQAPVAMGKSVAAEHERRLKQLYQRSLRSQRNAESLTYSGALSA